MSDSTPPDATETVVVPSARCSVPGAVPGARCPVQRTALRHKALGTAQGTKHSAPGTGSEPSL